MLIELHLDQERINEINNILKRNGFSVKEPKIFPLKGFFDRHFMYAYKETNNYDNISYKNQFMAFDKSDTRSQYGTADNIKQIQEYYKDLIDDPDSKWMIMLERIDQHPGASGGFRWNKNGPYIGKYDIQTIYFDDEDFGDDFQGYIISFNIIKVD